MMHFWKNLIYPLLSAVLALGRSLRHFLDKVKEWHFHCTSNEVIWPKKFQIPCTDQKVPFWHFFWQGRDGRALLVRPSRIPHRISKILFALGADEFLAMLEGKTREAPFFKVWSGKITVWDHLVQCIPPPRLKIKTDFFFLNWGSQKHFLS